MLCAHSNQKKSRGQGAQTETESYQKSSKTENKSGGYVTLKHMEEKLKTKKRREESTSNDDMQRKDKD